jgi:HrpA-like RNA helicase
VLRVDLTGAVLQLLCWGEADLAAFPWLTPPTTQALEQALKTLRLLQAVDEAGVTDLGRLMNKLPVQPRLARLLLAGHALGIPYAASVAAACLSERDVFDRQQPAHSRGATATQAELLECDVTDQVQTLIAFARHGERSAADLSAGSLKTGAARYVLRVADQLARMLRNWAPALRGT